MFVDSIVECYVKRGDVGLLVNGERGSEVETFRPKSETNCSVLNLLKFREVGGSREREGKRAVG